MAKSNDYRMAIKIAGEIEKSLYNSTDLTRKELNKIAREAARTSSMTKDSFAQGLKDTEPFFDGLEKAGVKAFNVLATAAAAAGTAIIGIGTASANVGIDFESSFAGVKKTTDATAQEYAQMKQEILAMTREIPAVGTEIAEVAEAAGQLGIEKKNLLAFTRTMIDLGESTNLAATEGASDLAKFANITKMSADNYGRLGSTIVALGNNFATTEADIVSMATRLASSGELAGFSEPQIMAMSTAISSVGIEAEAGGTAMSKMIKKVQVAVETGDKSLKKYASVAGMSVNEFKEAFEKDGLTAVASFISGLNDVERNGKSATVILNEMGLKEANLSNTLLSLANADELMLEAVEMANKAWEENTALTKEAAQRYETTESKLAIMKNGFTEMGITMYDQFNGPLRDGIDMITELVHEATEDISGSTVIHDIAQDIVDGIPTALRVMKQTAEVVGDFAEPFLEVGGWIADNPKLLTSTITGVGTALASYKVVKGVSSLAAAFTSLGPAALPVLGIAGGITAIAGVGTYFAQFDEEMTQTNLSEHFGDIALSMEEVNEAARQIVGDQYLDQLDELMSANITSDNLIQSMEEAIREMNAARWELSVGLSFSEEDKMEYAETAQQYIQDVQNLINNEGYTFQLSAELLLDGSVNMDEVITDNNAFYAELSERMQGIGDEVSTIINQALTDGLEINPAEIDKILAQAQEIQEALTEGESKAKLETLKAKFSGSDLDKDSIQNLMSEINGYIAESNEAVWDSYSDSVAKLEARKELDKDFTQAEYEAQKQELLQGTYSRQAETTMNAYDFLQNTLEEVYGKEINPVMESVEQGMRNDLNSAMTAEGWLGGSKYSTAEDWNQRANTIITDAITKTDGLGKSGDALNEMLAYMAPIREQIELLEQQVINNGGTLDSETQALLDSADSKINQWEAMTGDEESMWEYFGNIVGENEDYSTVFMAAQQNGAGLAQTGIDAIKEKQPDAEQAAKDFLEASKEIMEGGYDATIPINVGYNFVSEFNKTGKIDHIANNADGGIITSPTISWLAEGGYSEAVIPLDGSTNALNLWQRTGELLGVFNRKDGFHALKENLLSDYGSGGSSVSNTVNNAEDSRNIVFSPTIQISGNADSRDIENAMEVAFEKFEELLEQHERNRERFSFQ